MLATTTLSAQSDVQGLAAAGRAAEFPPGGLYAASNTFPLNSLVDVTDPASGRTVRVLVVSELVDPGIFVLLSPNAADRLGLAGGVTSSVRAREIILPGLTAVDPNLDLPFHADPDINPAASLGDPNQAIIAPDSRVAAQQAAPEPTIPVEPQQVAPAVVQAPTPPATPEPEALAPVVEEEPAPTIVEAPEAVVEAEPLPPVAAEPEPQVVPDPAPAVVIAPTPATEPVDPEQVTAVPLRPAAELEEPEPEPTEQPVEAPEVVPRIVQPPVVTTERQPVPPEPAEVVPTEDVPDPSFVAPTAPRRVPFIATLREPIAPEPVAERVPAESEAIEPVERETLPDPLAERLAAAQELREGQNVAITPLDGEQLDDVPRVGVQGRSELGLDLPPLGDERQLLEVNERFASPGDGPRIAADLPAPGDQTLPDISYPRLNPPDEPLRVALPVADPNVDGTELADTLRIAAGSNEEEDPDVPLPNADLGVAIGREQVPTESGELVPNRSGERVVTLEPAEFRTPPTPPAGESDNLAPNRANVRDTEDPLVAIIAPEPRDPGAPDAAEAPLGPGAAPAPAAAPPVALRDPDVPADSAEAEPVTADPPAPRVTLVPTTPEVVREPEPEPEPEPTPAPAPTPAVTTRQPALRDPDRIWAADNLPLVSDLEQSAVYLQVAALTDPRSAKRAVDGLGPSFPVAVLAQPRNGSDVYRVLVGPLAEDEKGSALVAVRGRGFRDAFVRNDP